MQIYTFEHVTYIQAYDETCTLAYIYHIMMITFAIIIAYTDHFNSLIAPTTTTKAIRAVNDCHCKRQMENKNKNLRKCEKKREICCLSISNLNYTYTCMYEYVHTHVYMYVGVCWQYLSASIFIGIICVAY